MAHFCETCARDFTNLRCPRCGGPPSTQLEDRDDLPRTGSVSDPDDTLDSMVEQASRPTLASLITRGINSGLIVPAHDYQTGDRAS